MAKKPRGPQLEVAPDGIETANLNDDVLSADADGRAKMASGYLNLATFNAKVTAGAVALDRLAEAVLQADGGQAWTGVQNANNQELQSLGAGLSPSSAARLQDVSAGKAWKELILHPNQLLSGGTGALLQAIAAVLTVNMADGDTFIITDGTTTETFTFLNAPIGAFDVQIGGSAAATQTNLVSQINTDSIAWSSVESAGLEDYFASAPATSVMIYRTVSSAANDRVHGVIAGGQAGIRVVDFSSTAEYDLDGTEGDLPSVDPTTKTFGFGRAFVLLGQNETHLVASNNASYTWDAGDDAWRQTDAGSIVAGAGLDRSADTIFVGAANASIVVNANDIEVGYGLVGDMAAAVAGAAAVVGTDPTAARIDGVHGHPTAAPVGHGTSPVAGASGNFADAAHIHPRDVENVEVITTQTITNADTAMTDTLNNTPLDVTKVRLYLNKLQQIQGAGNDFTISGITITWLALTGTAVNMKTTDSLIAVYDSQGS